jgi:hypothetical protein
MKHKHLSIALALIASIPFSAQAVSLVVNGNFEQTTNGAGQIDNIPPLAAGSSQVTGWTMYGFGFVFSNPTQALGSSFGGNFSLWGPHIGVNGPANGLSASPGGGNFIAADGDSGFTTRIFQDINGLTKGKQYTVGFDWAGAQQAGYSGATTEQWDVSLGSEHHTTAVWNNPSHGFSGWMHEAFTFTAQSTSATLKFLAVGTPVGVPPVSLLDSVTMTAAVPEPTSAALMLAGLGGLGLLGARLRQRGVPAAV